jgi:rod shape-determining protein MreC
MRPTPEAAVGLAEEDFVIRLSAIRRSSAQRIVMPLLILISATMIILGKIDQVIFESLRISVTDDAAPALDLLSRPLLAIESFAGRARAIVDTYQQNLSLVEENRRLLHWQQTALTLVVQNAQLRKLLKVVPEPTVSFVTARVIATSGGAFMRNVLVDAGSENGVARGQAAMTGDGLFGRVYEVGTRTARILSITDLNSRVPVIVEASRQRAILAGDNSEHPVLWYLDPSGPLNAGDRIVTSGEGGLFPPGIPVGVVVPGDPAAPRVSPFVQYSEVEFLRVADFGLGRELPLAPPISAPAAKRAASARTNCR